VDGSQIKKKISIVTPTLNEADNITELCDRVAAAMTHSPYDYEHLVIDNASTDQTVGILRDRASTDSRLKIIVNARNFGQVRSPFHGLLQATGSATIIIASDLQDPPEMIREFISRWEDGFKIVMAVKDTSEESFVVNVLRRGFYKVLKKFAEVPLIENATGAGLYDSSVIEIIRKLNDPYPYFRGLVCEIGFPISEVQFKQPTRKRGISSQSLYSLFDVAMLGLVKHSKLPLRVMTFLGFSVALGSFFVG